MTELKYNTRETENQSKDDSINTSCLSKKENMLGIANDYQLGKVDQTAMELNEFLKIENDC